LHLVVPAASSEFAFNLRDRGGCLCATQFGVEVGRDTSGKARHIVQHDKPGADCRGELRVGGTGAITWGPRVKNFLPIGPDVMAGNGSKFTKRAQIP
jgi:hypothetical protein